MATPMLAAIRSLNYQIDLLLNPTWAESACIFLESPHINDVRLVQEQDLPHLKIETRYRVALNTFWSGIGDNWLDHRVMADQHIHAKSVTVNFAKYHEIECFMAYAFILGFQSDIPLQWVSGVKWRNRGGRSVGLHSGCYGRGWEIKKWPWFRDLVPMLIKEGYEVRNFGGPGEELGFEGDGFNDYAGQFPLKATIRAMAECDYFIANDSGLMHVADALGIPTIALFGPTLVAKNRPVGKRSIVLQAKSGAYPECPECQYTVNMSRCKYQVCLDNIRPEDVLHHFKYNLVRDEG